MRGTIYIIYRMEIIYVGHIYIYLNLLKYLVHYVEMDAAVNQHYREGINNQLTSKDKELLTQTSSSTSDSNLQAEKFGGDTPCQQGSGTATVLDNASGQTNPNIIY